MSYCCEDLEYHANQPICPGHGHAEECTDVVIAQRSNGDFVLPIHDGAGSGISINNCPWCGTPITRA